MNTELMERNSVLTIVENVRLSLQEVESGISLLNSAQQRLSSIVADRYFNINSYNHKIPVLEETHVNIKKSVWQYLINKVGVYEICSVRQRADIDKMLYEGKDLPDITEENIISWFQDYIVNSKKLFNDSVKEVFDWLRPRKDRYKTNNRMVIGEKVIIEYGMDTLSSSRRVNYRQEQYYQAIDNVFHLLDGKGIAKYPETLPCKLNQAGAENKRELETDYFSCRWYKKGTLHIKFKRKDLLDKLNATAGGMNLSM